MFPFKTKSNFLFLIFFAELSQLAAGRGFMFTVQTCELHLIGAFCKRANESPYMLNYSFSLKQVTWAVLHSRHYVATFSDRNLKVTESFSVSPTESVSWHAVWYLEPRCRIEALYDLSVVKKTVGSVSDGDHATTAAVDVDAVHVPKRQADVRGWLG